MIVKTDVKLREFEFWSGAKRTADLLDNWITGDQWEELEENIDALYPDGIDETILNDIFWFEDDFIAELLGFASWEVMEDHYTSEVE